MVMKKDSPKVLHYSIRRQLLIGLFTVFLLFAFLVTGGSAYFTSVIRAQTYTSMKETLMIYENQMGNEFNALEKYLYGMINNSIDISVLDENQLDTNYYISINNIQSSLVNILPCFPIVDGMFVYSVKSDAFIYYAHSSVNYYYVIMHLQDLFRNASKNGKLDGININKWYAEQILGKYYFFRIIRVGNSYVGAWANTDTLLSAFNDMEEMGAKTMFLTTEGKVLTDSDLSRISFNPVNALNQYKMVKDADNISYLMITDRLKYIDYYLMTLVPGKALSEKLFDPKIALLLMGIMILLLGVLLILLLRKYFSRPIRSLLVAIDSLRAGNFGTKVDPGNVRCDEFIQVNHAFNDMVDKIQKLKIDIYEEQLDRKQIELKYLKSQVAPHFLINFLNTIYHLSANAQNHEIIRRMTENLSDHLRYTLANHSAVKLSEELKYIANYLELSNLRFPNCIHYEPDVDPCTENATVFPLLLMMFVENTVKHELVMGVDLYVFIKTRLIEKADGNRVRLTVIDSGEGFPEEFLQAVKQSDYTMQDEDGNHLGIENIIRRLRMEYIDNASISFSNEPDAGARIDIDIPYQPYQPEDHGSNRTRTERNRL